LDQQKATHLKPWHVAVVIVAALVTIMLMLAGGLLSPIVKRKLISTLKQTYQSEIEIRALNVSLFPYPSASGDGLVFRLHGRADIPPLIKLQHFDASTGWLNALRGHVGTVRLQGLEVRISHKDDQPGQGGDSDKKESKSGSSVVIDTIVADGSLVQMLPRDPEKEPLNFDIYKLTMTHVALDRPARYEAQLRNAKPPGLISVAGEFGPWNGGEPGKTPLTGKFQFSNADLGVFKGISGKLASTGEFKGVLDRLEVSGKTDTPDFIVKAGNHAVDLKTTYQATVDGTNGDTLLHPVIARFGQTTVTAEGGVTSQPGVKGKTVSLDSSVDRGNLADVLRLAVKAETSPIEGKISFRAKIVIPPGDRDIAEKLQLDGQFGIYDATFTSEAIENKVATLSERGQGDTQSGGQTHPKSNLHGKFVLANGIIRLTGLSFAVPGAQIRLNGTYGLLTERMDFRGTAIMDVKLSKMTTGVKSFFLKALDPIFSKEKKGAVIPIHIGGTRENPSIGLDINP
jgi:uncharacterized protein involved in outer membrane biogenesis